MKTFALAVTLSLASSALAQEDTPWSKGVTAEQKAQAQKLLEEGNAAFLRNDHRDALAKYEAATKAWDHPAIRFNIVRALINLDRPVEAFDNLELALRYGKDPLEEQVFAEAQNYRRLLLGQIAELEVSCSEQGARVTVDGKEFMSCPGRKSTRLLPGSHQVVARKQGFLTLTDDVVALPGKKKAYQVELISVEDATVTKRRWPVWVPWSVVGAGVLVGGIAGLLQLKAASDFDDYGAAITSECGEMGCHPEDLPAPVRDLESTARLENRIAIGLMVTGGAAVVTGLTMVFLNRPRPVVEEPKVAPAVTAVPGGGLVTLSGRF